MNMIKTLSAIALIGMLSACQMTPEMGNMQLPFEIQGTAAQAEQPPTEPVVMPVAEVPIVEKAVNLGLSPTDVANIAPVNGTLIQRLSDQEVAVRFLGNRTLKSVPPQKVAYYEVASSALYYDHNISSQPFSPGAIVPALQRVKKICNEHEACAFWISGKASTAGSDGYNVALADKRAKDLESQIAAMGFGPNLGFLEGIYQGTLSAGEAEFTAMPLQIKGKDAQLVEAEQANRAVVFKITVKL